MFLKTNQISCYKQLSGRCRLEKKMAEDLEKIASSDNTGL